MKAHPMTRIVTIVSALAIAASLVAPAHAGGLDPIVVDSKAVKTADLDLNTAAGARKALGRIERAARQLCIVSQTRFSAAQASQQRACAEAATVAAVDGAHSQMLSVVLAARMATTQLAGR
jgi:UrcA family protein